MQPGQLISKIYQLSTRKSLTAVEERNMELLIDAAERTKVLDLESLTKIRRMAAGGNWPDALDKAHDIELRHGAPTEKRKFDKYDVWEYYLEAHYAGGGSLVDNRVLCLLDGIVAGYTIYIKLTEGGQESLVRTSSSAFWCGRGRVAYFADDWEYRGIFGHFHGGPPGSFKMSQPPPGAKVHQKTIKW